MTPCSLINIYPRFGGTRCLHLQSPFFNIVLFWVYICKMAVMGVQKFSSKCRVNLQLFGNTIIAWDLHLGFFLMSYTEAGLCRPGYVALRHGKCSLYLSRKLPQLQTSYPQAGTELSQFSHAGSPRATPAGGGASFFRVAYWCVPRTSRPHRYDKWTKYILQCLCF